MLRLLAESMPLKELATSALSAPTAKAGVHFGRRGNCYSSVHISPTHLRAHTHTLPTPFIIIPNVNRIILLKSARRAGSVNGTKNKADNYVPSNRWWQISEGEQLREPLAATTTQTRHLKSEPFLSLLVGILPELLLGWGHKAEATVSGDSQRWQQALCSFSSWACDTLPQLETARCRSPMCSSALLSHQHTQQSPGKRQRSSRIPLTRKA